MPVFTRVLNLARLGLIHPSLMVLAWKLKKTGRTYLSAAALFSLARSFIQVKARNAQPIQVAEFGVGRGGSAILLAWLVERYGGKLTLFDVFGRIPAPTEIDGKQAQQRYAGILSAESQDYYGNIPDLLEVVKRELGEVCDPRRIVIVQGRYEDTLPQRLEKENYSLVHIDCDWYESSIVVYNYLRDNIQPGAILQVDDYSDWEGSRRAFQDADWLNPYQTRMVDGALVIDTARHRSG
jgi:predicted O-methyltransferase YrrM